MELDASSWNCMQAHGIACKFMELHASLCNCIQAYVMALKLKNNLKALDKYRLTECCLSSKNPFFLTFAFTL